MAPIKKPAATAAASGVNFGDDDFYGGSFNLQEGDYALSFEVRLHAYTKQDGTKGQENLGVLVTAYPMKDGEFVSTEPQEQFYSMGRKAKDSFMPNETGKGLVPIPGAPSMTLSGLTNWDTLRKSLRDSGLPKGIFTNDLSVLDGIWVHTQNVPEPAERKSLAATRSNTGEQAMESEQQNRGPQLISIVSEIKEDGKPWEGGGGLPEEKAASKPNGKIAPKAAAKPAATKKAAPVQEEADVDDVTTAALSGISAILDGKNGTTTLMLRTGTFKAVKEAYGDEMAQAVVDTFFGDTDALNGLLGQAGYVAVGPRVQPAK